ncbi:hypothetical protein [Pedococcus sp. 5OH_020]|uniref:hypothetical protein n=1 Tax=Pedococcus sp. 5OH_020 TaxID=2989814 RepID=UPI0022E9E708|nr:hypothetical protein [Pedococcus sp. 5OH_020]
MQLSPDASEASNLLTGVANTWARLFAYVGSIQSAQFQDLDPAPAWLEQARAALAANVAAGEQWLDHAPAATAAIVSPFLNYAATFRAFHAGTPVVSRAIAEQLAEDLGGLVDQLDGALDAIASGQEVIEGLAGSWADAHQLMLAAAAAAAAAHEQEHEALDETAAKIAELEERLSGLGENMRSSDLAVGRTFTETQVELVVAIAIGEVEIPFVGIGLAVLSVLIDMGEMIANSREIDEALTELYEALVAESAELQAVSALHTVLAVLQRIDDQYLLAGQPGRELQLLWEAERDKVQRVQEGLRAGADPAQMPDLVNLSAAAQAWDALAALAQRLLDLQTVSGTTIRLTPHPAGA